MRRLFLLVAVAVVVRVCGEANAQLSPAAVGPVLRLGAPGMVGLRGAAMGGAMVGSTDQSYNPAMIVRETRELSVRAGRVSGEGISFGTWVVEYTHPLSDLDALKAVICRVDSGNEPLGTDPIPTTIRFTGDHMSVLYGRRISENWTAGICLAPILNSDVSVGSPIGELARVKGRIKYDGARVGAAYEGSSGLRAAGQLDVFRVGTTVVNMGEVISADLRLWDLVLGVEMPLAEEWSVLAEGEIGEASSPGWSDKLSQLRLGLEYRTGGSWAFRAGLANGNPTAGFAYRGKRWLGSLAWMSNQYEDELRPVVGDASSLVFAATYQF